MRGTTRKNDGTTKVASTNKTVPLHTIMIEKLTGIQRASAFSARASDALANNHRSPDVNILQSRDVKTAHAAADLAVQVTNASIFCFGDRLVEQRRR